MFTEIITFDRMEKNHLVAGSAGRDIEAALVRCFRQKTKSTCSTIFRPGADHAGLKGAPLIDAKKKHQIGLLKNKQQLNKVLGKVGG
ncbi:MAG: hypothetical protein K6T94_26305 [Paenibacillus sp.]|nr:hypothetical protein [Paenibacillus sp.]